MAHPDPKASTGLGSWVWARKRQLSLAVVFELDVPVEIVPPAFGRVAEPDRDTDGWRGVRPPRRPQELHPCFGRRASTFPAIAGDAAGDDVLPVLPAAVGHRHH